MRLSSPPSLGQALTPVSSAQDRQQVFSKLSDRVQHLRAGSYERLLVCFRPCALVRGHQPRPQHRCLSSQHQYCRRLQVCIMHLIMLGVTIGLCWLPAWLLERDQAWLGVCRNAERLLRAWTEFILHALHVIVTGTDQASLSSCHAPVIATLSAKRLNFLYTLPQPW